MEATPLEGPFLTPWVSHGTPAPVVCLSGRTTFTVGRVAPADYVINHPAVSSIHLAFSLAADGSTSVTDRSSNGTILNGTRMEKNACARLKDGDVVSCVAIIRKDPRE